VWATTEPESYPLTDRVRPTRHDDRASGDAAAIHQVLDESVFCHLGLVVDGEPVVLPTIHARVGRALYLHASTGARMVRTVPPDGLPVCVTVTLLDGLVLARSQFSHSMNYRSVVVRGRALLVDDPHERSAALTAIVEHVVPGRSAASRPANPRELAATAVLRVDLTEVSLKQRSGPPSDDGEDRELPYWAGVIPVRTVFGPAEPLPRPAAEPLPRPPGTPGPPDPAEPPAHVSGYRRP
jgi:nitroimidazol reductase NimA-like FMN-containing flavoprotein (pyridoxamine 5'-phosphate oxidase superfamily)